MKVFADTQKASQKEVAKCQQYLQKSTAHSYLTRFALDYSTINNNTEDITKELQYQQQQAGNTWHMAIALSGVAMIKP